MLLGLGFLLIALGVLMLVTAGLWQIYEAFQTSTGWGILSILGFGIIFILVKPRDRWHPLALVVGSFLPMVLGMIIALVEFGLKQI